mmetsp:Transcript_10282/g.13468  ORF Transcript_10282/g.13468 Transcript_10282/m.13468 type:complete len:218 (+) Transcript_10282:36-689(+)
MEEWTMLLMTLVVLELRNLCIAKRATSPQVFLSYGHLHNHFLTSTVMGMEHLSSVQKNYGVLSTISTFSLCTSIFMALVPLRIGFRIVVILAVFVSVTQLRQQHGIKSFSQPLKNGPSSSTSFGGVIACNSITTIRCFQLSSLHCGTLPAFVFKNRVIGPLLDTLATATTTFLAIWFYWELHSLACWSSIVDSIGPRPMIRISSKIRGTSILSIILR